MFSRDSCARSLLVTQKPRPHPNQSQRKKQQLTSKFPVLWLPSVSLILYLTSLKEKYEQYLFMYRWTEQTIDLNSLLLNNPLLCRDQYCGY